MLFNSKLQINPLRTYWRKMLSVRHELSNEGFFSPWQNCEEYIYNCIHKHGCVFITTGMPTRAS